MYGPGPWMPNRSRGCPGPVGVIGSESGYKRENGKEIGVIGLTSKKQYLLVSTGKCS